MNDFYTETNLEHVDAAMDDMIECRKDENFLNQEDNNILHDLLTAHRHLIEQLFLEGKIPGQMEMGSSGSFEALWTDGEERMFARFKVNSLAHSPEEDS